MKTDNELIAEFMGWKRSDGNDGVYHRGQWFNDKFEHLALGAELEYSTSWDWLMPVVEKCNMICKETGYPGKLELPLSHIMPHAGSIKIIYFQTIEFIKWYNENKKL